MHLSPGYPPWQPPGTVRLQVFLYDRGAPVDGVFLYGEHQQFLYTRLRFDGRTGAGEYAYVPLSRRMLGRLQNASDDTYTRLRERYLKYRGVFYGHVTGTGQAQRLTGPAEPEWPS